MHILARLSLDSPITVHGLAIVVITVPCVGVQVTLVVLRYQVTAAYWKRKTISKKY